MFAPSKFAPRLAKFGSIRTPQCSTVGNRLFATSILKSTVNCTDSAIFQKRPTVLMTMKSIRFFHQTSKLCKPMGEDMIKNNENLKVPNKIGTFEHYRLPKPLLDEDFNYPVFRDTMGIRWPGYWFKRKFVYVPEMEPELVVPDLEGFQLKPYVSYKAEDIETRPFTAKELFDHVYAEKIETDFKLDSKEDYTVTGEEIDNARLKALQTGADLFEENPDDGVRAPIEHVVPTGEPGS